MDEYFKRIVVFIEALMSYDSHLIVFYFKDALHSKNLIQLVFQNPSKKCTTFNRIKPRRERQ